MCLISKIITNFVSDTDYWKIKYAFLSIHFLKGTFLERRKQSEEDLPFTS